VGWHLRSATGLPASFPVSSTACLPFGKMKGVFCDRQITDTPFLLFAPPPMSSPRDLFDELSPDSRSVASEVADYYCLQVAGSNELDFLTPLFQVRESLSCLALAGELSADIRAELAVIAPQLLSSVAIRDDSDRDQLPSLALPELSLWVAAARLYGEDFDGDDYDPCSVSSPGRLLDHESFRRGDLVYVSDRASEHFGRAGRFGLFTDPRIGHPSRMAQVDFGYEEEGAETAVVRETIVVRPNALRFAPERYGNERGDSHLRTLVRDGFELRIFDTGRSSRQGKIVLHYQLFDRRFEDGGIEPIFEGSDFFVSPLHAPDEDSTLATLLGFLSYEQGNIEADYFGDYTPRQIAWRDERASDLSLVVWDMEESGTSDSSDV